MTDPAFSLVTSNRVEVNRGESTRLTFYFVGAGDIEKNALTILYPYPKLLKNDEVRVLPGFINMGYDPNIGSNRIQSRTSLDNGEDYIQKTSTPSFKYTLADHCFEPPRPYSKLTGEDRGVIIGHGSKKPDIGYDRKLGEMNMGKSPPLQVEFNIAEDAAPGNYSISCRFMYGTENHTYISEKDTTIHVNSLSEQLEPWPTIVAVIAGVAGVIALLYQIGTIG